VSKQQQPSHLCVSTPCSNIERLTGPLADVLNRIGIWQVTYNRIYAPVDITKGNTTVQYNQPGVNWGEGECSMRDVIEADEGVLPTCPGDEIQYPACGLYDTVRLAVRAAVDGQTVVVAEGQHVWFGVCHVISDSLMRKRLVKIRGAGRGGFEHVMSSKGRDYDADQDEVVSITLHPPSRHRA
jgi:hypothetical protein